jgi:tRNA (mo5U34)-methyltransferase
MDVAQQQARIDAIDWYHEFDFGNGLQARSRWAHAHGHHKIWQFIERHLEAIDFRDRTVLDVGCWDGRWSFYAERRGARSVLAADDRSQNCSGGRGLLLARELLGSAVEVNQDLSVYDLASLGRTFDVILLLGVYYHLVDPFYAFAQVRRCCHRDSLVVVEGDVALAAPPHGIIYDLADHARSVFLPTAEALRTMLQGAYLSVGSQAFLHPQHSSGKSNRPGWGWRLRTCARALFGAPAELRALEQSAGLTTRALLVCRPFAGVNPLHVYRPPFGLDAYDDRFRTRAVA